MNGALRKVVNDWRRHLFINASRPYSSKPEEKVYSALASQSAAAKDNYKHLPLECQISLGEQLPKLPQAKYLETSISQRGETTKVEKLSNGLTVVSEPWYGEFCTIGAVVNAGSRYESQFPLGVSHLLEKLAFTPGSQFAAPDDIRKVLEVENAIVDCQHTKDSIIYASSCSTVSAEVVLQLIMDSVLQPKFGEQELSTAREVVRSNVKSITTKPEPEELLNDLIHAAGFRDNTLGLPKYCPIENVEKIDRNILYSFMKNYYTPDRIIVGGVGVPHESLVDTCNKLFQNMRPVWANEESSYVLDQSIAQFTGGEIRIDKDLSSVGQAMNPFPELAHVVIGLESCKLTDEDFVPVCVVNSLMGGGGSFSAGGPGKGMYTRLYMDVLNRYHWIYNATSVNLSYADSGIFFIRASASPENLNSLTLVIINALLNMSNNLSEEELNRAKTQLKSSLLMNLEQRPVRFEDMTRQVLGQGRRKSPLEYSSAIEKVRISDIARVVDRLLSSTAAVVGYGSLDKLPDYGLIDSAIGKRDISKLSSKKFFV